MTVSYTSRYIGSYIGIGMNDIAEEGVYIWDDGSPVTHIRFAQYEPNNYGGDEDCMALWTEDGGLADYGCNGFYFICETDYNTLLS